MTLPTVLATFAITFFDAIIRPHWWRDSETSSDALSKAPETLDAPQVVHLVSLGLDRNYASRVSGM